MNLATQKKVAFGLIGAVALVGAVDGLCHLFKSAAGSPHQQTAATPRTTYMPPTSFALPVQQSTPAASVAPPAFTHLDNTDEKHAKLKALAEADMQRLQARGLVERQLLAPFGRTCQADGTTNGDGYHGTSTAISYSVTSNGQSGKVCIEHGGKGGIRANVGNFAPN